MKLIEKDWFKEKYGKPGMTSHFIWSHDDGCGIFKQKRCNCDPDYRIVVFDDKKQEDNWLSKFYKTAKVPISAILFGFNRKIND